MGIKLPSDLPTLLKQLRAEGVAEFECEGDVVRVRFGDRPLEAKQPEKKNPPRKLAAVVALEGFQYDPNAVER